MPMIRRPPSCARPRPSGQTHDLSVASPEISRYGPDGRECETLAGPGGGVSCGPPAARTGVPLPTDAPDPALERRIKRLLQVKDEDEFLALALRLMDRAVVDLMVLIPALADDGRVSDRYKGALAAQLEFLRSEHFEEWIVDLCEGRDVSEWRQAHPSATGGPRQDRAVGC